MNFDPTRWGAPEWIVTAVLVVGSIVAELALGDRPRPSGQAPRRSSATFTAPEDGVYELNTDLTTGRTTVRKVDEP